MANKTRRHRGDAYRFEVCWWKWWKRDGRAFHGRFHPLPCFGWRFQEEGESGEGCSLIDDLLSLFDWIVRLFWLSVKLIIYLLRGDYLIASNFSVPFTSIIFKVRLPFIPIQWNWPLYKPFPNAVTDVTLDMSLGPSCIPVRKFHIAYPSAVILVVIFQLLLQFGCTMLFYAGT